MEHLHKYKILTIHEDATHFDSPSLIERLSASLQKSPGKRFLNGNYSRLPSASVCVIIKNDVQRNQPVTLLVRRRVIGSDPWSGDMAFPGGRTRKEDDDEYATASREVHEETGIDLARCNLLGTLDDLIPNIIPMRVTPFVALAPENTDAQIDGREIVDHIWIPMGFFMNASNMVPYTVERSGKKMEVTSFNYLGKHVIWGMSFRILTSLITKLRG